MADTDEGEVLHAAIIEAAIRLFGADKAAPGKVLEVAMAHIVVGVMQMRLSAPDNDALTIAAGMKTAAEMADLIIATMDAKGPPQGLDAPDVAERLIARAAHQISAEKGMVASAVFRMTRKK